MKKEKGILSSYDSLDIDEVVIAIEKTFHLKFDERDFEKVKTYGDFENLVLNKIEGRETEDCCSQQTFYKLRKIFIEEFNIPFEKINPKTQLENIFPSKNRIKKVSILKDKLKTEVNFLKPDFKFSLISAILIILSIYYFFNQFLLGLFLFVIGIFCLKIAQDFGKEFYQNLKRKVCEVFNKSKGCSISTICQNDKTTDLYTCRDISKQVCFYMQNGLVSFRYTFLVI